jgi:hypothetical protein
MLRDEFEESNQQPTVRLKQCNACAGELFESHTFCRWCGSNQVEARTGQDASAVPEYDLYTNRITVELRPHNSFSLSTSAPLASAPAKRMHGTQALTDASFYHKVSEPLVKAITASLSTRAATNLSNRCLRRLVLALISVPVWMILILLSPLDAYLASKALLQQSESSTL